MMDGERRGWNTVAWAAVMGGVLGLGLNLAKAEDWPAQRFDAARSAASPEELPRDLKQAWVRNLPKLTLAWPDQVKLKFDEVHEPIVAGGKVFVGSSHDDSVAAFDAATGGELWRFYADGPVRFAPYAWKDRLFVASDDGRLYCLKAETGEVAWKMLGGPSERKLLGNQRMISMWPARGAPVVADGVVYFAAGIWPFMGVFLHAVDAETGQVLWTNSGDGSRYIKQPHNTDSFAGVAPQGPLAVQGDVLLVPGGRSVPAGYDRKTGELRYYELAANGKRGGGATVAAAEGLILNGGAVYDLADEKHLGSTGDRVVFRDGRLIAHSGTTLKVHDLKSAKRKVKESVDRTGKKVKTETWTIDELGETSTPELTVMIQAGSRLYAGAGGKVLAYGLPFSKDKKQAPIWEAEIQGTPGSMAASDGRLFVTTREGSLVCFADAAQAPKSPKEWTVDPPKFAPADVKRPSLALLFSGGGGWLGKDVSRLPYGLLIGADAPDQAVQLARQGNLRWVVVEKERRKAAELRRQLREAQIGAEWMAVLHADPDEVQLPPYFASTIVDPNPSVERMVKLFEWLRPFGGSALLAVDGVKDLKQKIAAKNLPGAAFHAMPDEIPIAGEWTILAREGGLPGSANWTHEHADAANTRVSKDQVVKTPLGLLWFGGPSHDVILPRHGHGPQPQVFEGRLFIEGMDLLRATDVYTGRLLWETSLPGLGKLYANTAHQPGANAIGANYVSTPTGVYVAYENACLRLDLDGGEKTAVYRLPPSVPGGPPPVWSFLTVAGDYLIGGSDPMFEAQQAVLDEDLKKDDKKKDDKEDPKGKKPDSQAVLPKAVPPKAVSPKEESPKIGPPGADALALLRKVVKLKDDDFASSGRLSVLDRRTGDVLWSIEARSGFRHNSICIGGGKLFVIDRLSGAHAARLKRRGEKPEHEPQVLAFDLASGAKLWSVEQEVFGTWLSYSEPHDIVVEAGRVARDVLGDEPKGMRAYQGADGKPLWFEKGYSGPAMIHHDQILMAGSACDLRTGALKQREHPLSGEMVPWTWSRNYGCNTPMASEHLLTFRSGAAGYFDFRCDGGTGNFGGFKSSCSNNLVVACGVLSAPDYTRTCTCSYQNQTSLALVPMPDAEVWTSFDAQEAKQPIRRVGLNLGAPGDRKDDGGLLWIDFPSVGGKSPEVEATIEPKTTTWFRSHSALYHGPGLTWVSSSGAQGLTSLRVELGGSSRDPRVYTVRLHFAEPDEQIKPGQRVFDVKVQGASAVEGLDVVKEAGGVRRSLVKEIAGVKAAKELLLEFTPAADAARPQAVLSGVEILAEGW